MIPRNTARLLAASVGMLLFIGAANGKSGATIPAGSKVYVAPMDGFETYLKAALDKKNVPLTVVENKQDAEYEITGTASTQKAGTAKKIIMGSWHSKEEASIQVADLKTGVVVFAYSYANQNSAHGKRSSAEACAKHLKDAIGSK
jgi:hypothetical protein